MKLFAMGIDENGRSTADFLEIKMNRVSDTESLSNKQDGGGIWRIGFRHNVEHHRTDKAYTSPAGPYEMHVGGAPHFVGCMSGHPEITMQDGGAWRLAAGEFLYVRPGALHHSNNPSTVPITIFNLYMPGTAKDTKPYPFK